MAFRLIPREMRFYDDFIALAEQIHAGAMLLEQMLAPDRPLWEQADAIKDIEHNCDNLTHEIIQRLHRTFVTPLDREDIHMLASSLDDVIDAIDEAAANVRLYRLDHVRPEAREMARHHQGLHRRRWWWRCAPSSAAAASPRRPSSSTVSRTRPTACIRTRCSACSTKRRDPIVIMKWKEIIDLLEEATDRCEDVANVVEGVVVKHA